jgi:mono/diheme cytochrome c family protein
MRCALIAAVLGGSLLPAGPLAAQEIAAERGYKALITRAFTPAAWPASAYDELWKQWQPAPKERPADYDRAVREHYGLHPAPFDNGRYPMGLREAKGLLGKGITSDCLLCHGGSILGKSYVGLGNASLDIDALFDDLNKASGRTAKLPFTFCNVRGTCEAAGFAVMLHSYREPDLKVRLTRQPFALRDDVCEDTPAWWLLHKKKTMYYTGSSDARSVRSIMQFMLNPLNGRATFEKEEPTFADIRAYLVGLRPPAYPFPVDRARAARGAELFAEHCARCHGSYGTAWTYPNKVVAPEVIGTDATRLTAVPREVGEFYNKSWFAKETGDGYTVVEAKGYQAPPLDGVWATAPYFHNGSAPTLYDVLNSKSRPKVFTRSYRTAAEDYETIKVGWKVQPLERGPDANLSPYERRKVYDTTQPGRSNTGHTFGDELTEDERRAVIEYLKTL